MSQAELAENGITQEDGSEIINGKALLQRQSNTARACFRYPSQFLIIANDTTEKR